MKGKLVGPVGFIFTLHRLQLAFLLSPTYILDSKVG